VAKGRAVTASTVREKFGQGLMFSAKEAVERGMADRVATLDETVSRLLGGGRVAGPRAAAVEPGPSTIAAGDLARRRRALDRFRP